MRRLIVNADDFGLTTGVNRAIIETHASGVVTSATLMANGPAFSDAIRSAQSAPTLDNGCHVVFLDGKPLLDASRISSLVDPQKPSQFREQLSRFALLAVRGGISGAEIEAEATAQIRKLQAFGIAVSHVDTHKHTHVFPQVFKSLLRAAVACGVRSIRNPFEVIRLSAVAKDLRLWKRYTQVKLVRNLAHGFRRAVHAAGMLTPDGTIGIAATGTLNESMFTSLLENMPQGTWEFVCHPGYNDADLKAVKTRLRESRVQELELLRSERARELLRQHEIELISYRDLG
ncbi:MAG: ChbG/HpnK family deacetylase [Acidobacteriota bacterium]|nr:ChbG/HpnK family deacetylase [Acidobacteriota bacterium]